MFDWLKVAAKVKDGIMFDWLKVAAKVKDGIMFDWLKVAAKVKDGIMFDWLKVPAKVEEGIEKESPLSSSPPLLHTLVSCALKVHSPSCCFPETGH